MRVLITGASGFVGRWLARELDAAGHEVVPTPSSAQLDLLDARATHEFVRTARPDAVAHLAAIAFGPDAARDPNRALRVNEGATINVLTAIGALGARVPVLVSGSSDVYGNPEPVDLPLDESAPLRAIKPYGRSKLAQEKAALRIGAELGVRTVVTRSFNHTGPGQRLEFVGPALAARIDQASRAGDSTIPVGNVDVRRDLGDVRDVVRAYRLLLEVASEAPDGWSLVANVCTGRAIAIREVARILAELSGIDVTLAVDPTLVRGDDPPEIVGDATRLRSLTGWRPEISLERTLADVLGDIRSRPSE